MSKTQSNAELSNMWLEYERPRDGDTYRHYKGGLYTIVATGFLEDTETPCIVYKSQKLGIIWVRTAKNFLETIEHDGVTVQRFKLQP